MGGLHLKHRSIAQSALSVLWYVKSAIKPIGHQAYQVIGPYNQVGFRIRAEPIVQHFALKLREHLNQELHIVIDRHVSIYFERFKQYRLPVLGHDRLTEGRIDAVLNRLLEELPLRGQESNMVIIPGSPTDGASDLIQIKLSAEDAEPPRNIILTPEVPIKRLAGNIRFLANL